MRILLDTHALLWAARGTLPMSVDSMLRDEKNELFFSVINLWEIELKRERLNVDVRELNQNLIRHGYRELALSARHVLFMSRLPMLHKDPFDRMLLAQAMAEKTYLLTADQAIGEYGSTLDFVISFKQ